MTTILYFLYNFASHLPFNLRKEGLKMFGNKKEEFEKMVEKGHWEKLEKKCESAKEEERVWIAEACGMKVCDETSNLLSDLLKDPSDTVKLAAIHSLEQVGNDHAVSQLEWVLNNLKPEQKELHDAVLHTLEQIRGKR